jgi:hypothetical protein
MGADVIELDQHRPPVLVPAAELARYREIELRSTLLLTEIYNRRAKRWFRAPMALVEPLRAALLRGK